jgi:hypothetical protein
VVESTTVTGYEMLRVMVSVAVVVKFRVVTMTSVVVVISVSVVVVGMVRSYVVVRMIVSVLKRVVESTTVTGYEVWALSL